MKRNNEGYSKGGVQQNYKSANSPRPNQAKNYDSFKAKLTSNQNSEGYERNRKHNSPDAHKYLTYATKNNNEEQIRLQGKYQKNNLRNHTETQERKERESQQSRYNRVNRNGKDTSHTNNQMYRKQQGNQRMTVKERVLERQQQANMHSKKQLIKNPSSPTLNHHNQENKYFHTQENQDYQKLHQKLTSIQNKIADMKKNVQKKKEEKIRQLEQKKIKEKQKEQRRQQMQKQKEKKQEKEREKSRQIVKKADLKQFITQVPEHQELHSFEKNPYSPNHNIYYISQIIKSYQDEKSLGREHLLTSLHIFRILQNSRFLSDHEMKQRSVILPKRAGFQNKKCVIFDLDETLIHCNDTLIPPFDIKLPITFPTGQIIEAGINIRPYTNEILRNLAANFEVIVFTASHSCYANVVLDYLDPKNEYIHHRLYREHCYQTPEGMYSKDLRVLNRNLAETVLVDNAAYSYAAQPENGIPILPYYHGKTDFELRALEAYILTLLNVPDVRTVNTKTFQFDKYKNYYTEPETLVEELYMLEEIAIAQNP